jgi:hypothetical protein
MRAHLRRWIPLLLLLALLLPLHLRRAALEGSLWLDETFSLMLAAQPVSHILDFSTIDTNPPGYFLALKAWLKLGRALAGEPGILWARSLGILAWLALAAGTGWLGRRLCGPALGAALAWVVAGSGYAGWFAKDARGYSLATVALFLAFLALHALFDAARGAPKPALPEALLWATFAAGLAAAFWTHILSGLVAALLALLWLAMTLALGGRRRRFAWGGAAALAAAFLAVLPWALRLRGQAAALRGGATDWMTPATGETWRQVFLYWFPFGPSGDPASPPAWFWAPLGVLSLAAPLALFLIRASSGRERRSGASSLAPWLAGSGLAIALLFTTTLWLLQRLHLAAVFHASRYPALTAAFWAAGLAGLAFIGGGEGRARGLASSLALVPWLLASALGQSAALRTETERGSALRATLQAAAAGAPLFVLPPELMPFHRELLRGHAARRIEELPCALPGLARVAVLDLNFWPSLSGPRDLIAARAIADGRLAQERAITVFPYPERDFTLTLLGGLHGAAARALCGGGERGGFAPAPRPIPPDAASRALPEDQLFTDGWSFLELDGDFALRRWGTRSTVRVVFDRPLPPGDYALHFRGYRAAHPEARAIVRLRLAGTTAERGVTSPGGEIDERLDLHLDRALARPVLVVEHPTWSPRDSGSPGDPRVLSVLLRWAWIEKRR